MLKEAEHKALTAILDGFCREYNAKLGIVQNKITEREFDLLCDFCDYLFKRVESKDKVS